MIYGVDVSGWQNAEFPLTIDDKPVDFAIIKATQGLGFANPKWREQTEWARKNGLSVGFYHFVDAGSITKQADFFLATLGALRPGDHLWFDWENADVTDIQKDEWIRYVQAARPGHKVGLYCNRHFWLNRDVTEFAGDALWIADWTGFGTPPEIQAAWRVHQYSTAHSLDRNVADFESRAAMKEWAGLVEPVDGDLGGLMEAVGLLVDAVGRQTDVLRIQQESLVRVESEIAILRGDSNGHAASLATLKGSLDGGLTGLGLTLQELVAATKKVQAGQAALPKKVADEINKRLAQ